MQSQQFFSIQSISQKIPEDDSKSLTTSTYQAFNIGLPPFYPSMQNHQKKKFYKLT
jgi:hypothetical protein